MSDKSRGHTPTLVLRQDCHLVQPTAVAVVSGHRGADYRIFVNRDQKHVVRHGELGGEYLRRGVVRGIVGKDGFPKCDDAGTVGAGGGSYDHCFGWFSASWELCCSSKPGTSVSLFQSINAW